MDGVAEGVPVLDPEVEAALLNAMPEDGESPPKRKVTAMLQKMKQQSQERDASFSARANAAFLRKPAKKRPAGHAVGPGSKAARIGPSEAAASSSPMDAPTHPSGSAATPETIGHPHSFGPPLGTPATNDSKAAAPNPPTSGGASSSTSRPPVFPKSGVRVSTAPPSIPGRRHHAIADGNFFKEILKQQARRN